MIWAVELRSIGIRKEIYGIGVNDGAGLGFFF